MNLNQNKFFLNQNLTKIPILFSSLREPYSNQACSQITVNRIAGATFKWTTIDCSSLTGVFPICQYPSNSIKMTNVSSLGLFLLVSWELVVTWNQNHWIVFLFNIIQIFHKFKKKYCWTQKFSNNAASRKQDILSEEKIIHCSHFVNKDILQSWFNKNCYL